MINIENIKFLDTYRKDDRLPPLDRAKVEIKHYLEAGIYHGVFGSERANRAYEYIVEILAEATTKLAKAETEANSVASSRCPICSHDTPHGHSNEEIASWLKAQASRLGRSWDLLFPPHIDPAASDGKGEA